MAKLRTVLTENSGVSFTVLAAVLGAAVWMTTVAANVDALMKKAPAMDALALDVATIKSDVGYLKQVAEKNERNRQ